MPRSSKKDWNKKKRLKQYGLLHLPTAVYAFGRHSRAWWADRLKKYDIYYRDYNPEQFEFCEKGYVLMSKSACLCQHCEFELVEVL